ncbi:MAG: zinc ribbon domain-containing protein [Gemmatimonadetes bacterium]|nr:zinc ribbon domain-containing protein [Gemmatimonadota bacterium]NIQ60036.1 zinc ribbon domain-containing protein [Gemmatimonadota bacterium]NIU80254.1 zinc ribbon domain-containing protein [Gammaproteobacteria bacterium]NIX48636.1 zinc ribbon domain-containing protein [Gemmatimonadota bacterium]NIY13076.1 zinc ribbon domain-containing protein [Gemmatimonadota bacterium]
MPTYEYRCPEGHEFEKFQRMSDPPEAECPECGQAAERILSGGAGLLFKGEGFYITDYRSDSYRKAAARDEGKSAGAGSDKAASGGSGAADTGGSDSGSTKAGKETGKGKGKAE